MTIVSRVLAVDALAAGLLQAPFAQSLTGDAYHFVCAAGLAHRGDITALRTWFQASFATL
ncbi:hypothetical protein [Agrobacterium rosae]|uniref:hypothetical protein n=1 Tax=Agrobacterium rosae TaxID=1972867 RepID=UPI003A80200C